MINDEFALLCGDFLKNLPSDYFMKKEGCPKNIKNFLADSFFDYVNAQAVFV